MENFTDTQREIVEKFLSLLTGLTRECGIEIVDTGGFVFRMHEGKPYLTVSRDFLQNLGNHAIVLTLDAPATSDVVAVLETARDVVKITRTGEAYSATCSEQLSNRQPLYIRQLLNRKTLSSTEHSTLITYLQTHHIEIESITTDTTPSHKESPAVNVQNSDSDAEDSEIESPVKKSPPQRGGSFPDEKKSQVHVKIPSENDSEDSEKAPPEKSPVKAKSPVSEVKSQKLSVIYFKKNRDGTKDKTICRSGKYVYKVIKGDKLQLIGIGVYDSKTNNYTPLSKADRAEIVKLGFTV